MAVEAKRGCGYRKVGGLYMVSGGLASPCGRLPIELHVCPTCNAGIKQTRAWQWIKPRALLANGAACDLTPMVGRTTRCAACPLDPENLPETAGLLWIGEKFYPTAREFMAEAHRLGVSRRIPAIPRNFKLGETWVLVAHPKALERTPKTDDERAELHARNRARVADDLPLVATIERAGIITMFKPVAIEKIVTESQARDVDAMAQLEDKGITPVVVPDNDPHHQGSAHDKEEESDDMSPPQGVGGTTDELGFGSGLAR